MGSLCNNGSDDDGDGLMDCAEPLCACSTLCSPTDGCPSTDLGSTVGTDVGTGSTHGACSFRSSATCGGASGEITFRWVAPSAGAFTFTTAGSSFDTVLYLLDGSCGGAELSCHDDISADDDRSSLTHTLTNAQTIIIVVDGAGSQAGDVRLSISGP